MAAFELNALLILQLLGQLFIPVYIQSGVTTLPEYIKKRFGGRRLSVLFSTMSLLLYILTKISVNLYSGSIFVEMALGWNTYASVSLLVVLTALMTITGGLTAVMYTDAAQALILIAGALILTVMGLDQIGTWDYGLIQVISAP